MSNSTRAVFIGDGTLLVRCAEAFRSQGHQVAAVASGDAAILAWAQQQGIPAETIEGAPRLEGVEFDYLFSVAHLQVLPAALTGRARRLAINFHDGPLPRYAGLNATAWAVMASETEHGVTWHEMTAEVDRGRIVRQELFDLSPTETALSLNARCWAAGFECFRAILDDITHGQLALSEQPPEVSYFGRHQRPKALATLDWTQPAAELAALVRGLDFGSYANPLALPKVWLGEGRLLFVRTAQALPAASAAAPGTVLESQPGSLRVATGQGELVLQGLRTGDGQAAAAVPPGTCLPAVPAPVLQRLEGQADRIARGEAHWRRALTGLRTLDLPYPRSNLDAAVPAGSLRLQLQAKGQGADTLAAFAAWIGALCGQEAVSLSLRDTALLDAAAGARDWLSSRVPFTLQVRPADPVRILRESSRAQLELAHRAGPLACDLQLRLGQPAPAWPLYAVSFGADCVGGALLELHAAQTGDPLQLHVDTQAFTPDVARVIAGQLDAFLQAFADAQGCIADLPLVPPDEAVAWQAVNDTATRLEPELTVPQVIEAMAQARPDGEALRWHGESLTQRELQDRAQALACVLRERGVQPGDVVGLALDRRPELLVAVLAIHKAGAAYLPLDPDYPAERLRFMVQDSQTRQVICRPSTATLLGLDSAIVVSPDARPAGEPTGLPQVQPDSPAYVIYTSGSTGQPKGVVVTHANVINFFEGMDRRIPFDAQSRWLAVTSLSFDISVLELLWTLSRGVTVVLHSNVAPDDGGATEFSLFYFSSDESAQGGDRYRLLMEGARFADTHGFAAVWTPERHFHAFGGLYPNPMITSAAVAACTQRVKIRAGSCVLPLHHPVQVTEDWSLVDNLSNGRVGVSFAAGWQPNDFVLAPGNFAQRKQLMLDGIDTVRRLWAGDAMEFPGHDGKPVTVRTLPRPVQRELPIWLTAASNPETFQQAGEKGCHVLTHLLGQTVEDVAQKVALYRQAWRDAGHAGRGQVSLMLHTFVGDDEDRVRETARGPMKAYLRSSVDLIRQAAWSFPTFVQRGAAAGRTPLEVMQEKPLSEEELDALLDHAFSRYWNTSALIGTPERSLAMVRRLQEAGVDEIACLIDFGIDTDTVLGSLGELERLMRLAQRPRRAADASVAAQITAEGVTHLQCTPSMATMLVADASGRQALSQLSALLVGGEALSVPLARQLRELVPGLLLNMYGPTETTVWSTCCDLAQVHDVVPLGEPIANTVLRVRNAWGQDCPALVPGELLIGGAGVTRGYHGREELTAQRFIDDPREPGLRLYRTGDLVRLQPDGRIEFLGRLDHQVKIRGHRIELGEIENALAREPGVREAVVLSRPDSAGEAFLVGYVTATDRAAPPDADQLRKALAQQLPDVMVPRLISVRASLPLTPNGKVDRKALAQAAPAAAPQASAAPSGAPASMPGSPLEKTISAIWCEVLGLPEVARESNFFDLGGHSLLVIQVQRRLKEVLGQEISITDMFRLSTVAAIASHLGGSQPQANAVNEGLSRAQARRALRTQAIRA